MQQIKNVIEKIRELVNEKGYIYAFCMILFEDFHVNPETLHKTNYHSRLSTKEASLLLGFLIQNKIDFTFPQTLEDLINQKQKTYNLMEELHKSLMSPVIENLQNMATKDYSEETFTKTRKDVLTKGNILIEPIFYSAPGVYDVQYLKFLEKKYKYDKDWLFGKKDFVIEEAQKILGSIVTILQNKSKQVHLYGLKETIPEKLHNLKKTNPKVDWKKEIEELQPLMEFYQYIELFPPHIGKGSPPGEDDWEVFYRNLIDLFVCKRSDFDTDVHLDSFIKNFSISPGTGLNSQFDGIGKYNLINSHPIIELANDTYFVPITFLLFEAVYESPFYWMFADKEYRDQAGKHRGDVGEEIAYNFLLNVFGPNRTFKSVKVTTKKGQDYTDIDVLCILGSKALCVQVKSKKLTELARTGDDNALHADFKGAVQDAYGQGLICRKQIMEKGAIFLDEHKQQIKPPEEIDDVYIMAITTENYPALTHQTEFMLEKEENSPFPIVLTIFDLELLTHYLNDPYDFLYYIRQRISLIGYFEADEELIFLGYHLENKLSKIPRWEHVGLDAEFGQLIDRNYYPFILGLEISDEGDTIKNRWKNEKFDRLCWELKNIKRANITDVLFHLFDLSSEERENLVNFMVRTKKKTLLDGKPHDFSMPPGDRSAEPRLGFTYYSLNCDDSQKLLESLLFLCQARKYKSKSDFWVGFGSLISSGNMVDIIAYSDHKWEYDDDLERMSEQLFSGRGSHVWFGKKIGRNDKCPCGSMLKYKNCCGKN